MVLVQGPLGPASAAIADVTWGVLSNQSAHVPMLADFLNEPLTMKLEYESAVNRMTLGWEYEARQVSDAEPTEFELN